jgi:hypothetical protein
MCRLEVGISVMMIDETILVTRKCHPPRPGPDTDGTEWGGPKRLQAAKMASPLADWLVWRNIPVP